MPQEIGWSVEAKLLYQIKQLASRLGSSSSVKVYPNFASFPTPGTSGVIYVDEATTDLYIWNGSSYIVVSSGSSGITSLNSLIDSSQTFATGTSGSNFNISSAGGTHTFNIPTASATNRGLLSSIDWTTFNNKQSPITLTTTGTSGAATFIGNVLNIPNYQISLSGTFNYVSKFTVGGTSLTNSIMYDSGIRVGVGTGAPGAKLHVVGDIWANTTIKTGDLITTNSAFGTVAKTASTFRIGSVAGNEYVQAFDDKYLAIEINGNPYLIMLYTASAE